MSVTIEYYLPLNIEARAIMGPTEMVAIEYVTKWVEAHVGRTNIAKVVAQILCENIIIGFGCPLELVVDCGTHFLNATIKQLMTKYLIKH
jgi:hypothetical protein